MLKHFRAVAKAVRGELIPEIPSQEKILAVLAAFCAVNIAAVWASAWVAGRLFGFR